MTNTERGHRAAYFWPLNVLYVSKSGIKRALAHEFAHVLDVLAGPFEEETEQKFGRRFICTRTLYSLYPPGGKFPNGKDTASEFIEAHFAHETNFLGRFALAGMMLGAQIAREKKGVYVGVSNNFLDSTLDASSDTNDFVSERVAHMLEEHVFVCQERDGIAEPQAVPKRQYFEKDGNRPIFWGKEWLTENETHVLRFYKALVRIILTRRDDATLLQRIKELRSHYQTPLMSSLEEQILLDLADKMEKNNQSAHG